MYFHFHAFSILGFVDYKGILFEGRNFDSLEIYDFGAMSQQRVTRAYSAAEAAAEATAAIVDESVNNAASTAESTGANIVTPSKRNAAVAANVKPKKPKVNKYFYFKMAAGMEDAFVEGIQAANLHREEYGGLVEDERGFPYKKEFTAFKKQLQNPD